MSYNVRAAIIGGTGLYSLEGMELIEEIFLTLLGANLPIKLRSVTTKEN